MYTKYPRTPHLPWSPGASADDEVRRSLSNFDGREIVVTEKMDGENTSIYRDHVHARSLDSAHHPSRSWVKGLQGRIGPMIPEGWRLCGENCFAVQSIAYDDLASYFLLFSVWDGDNRCLSWDETLEWAEMLDLAPVPVLYRGTWNEAFLRKMSGNLYPGRQEGFVVRTAEGFPFEQFRNHVAKWVRPNYVTTDEHWMSRPVQPNRLRGGS